MVISPNSFEKNNSLRDNTLIPNPTIVKSFDLSNIDKDRVTISGLHTKYPSIIYNKETGLFNGYYRDPRMVSNLWWDLKSSHPDLYESQLADLTSAPHPSRKNREEYKKFLKDHQLLINTMEVFTKEWQTYFKRVIGIPDDHTEYKIIREWASTLKRSLDFIKDFLADGGSVNLSDERLSEYHQEFIDNITIMSVSGSNNPFKMIITLELKDAELDKISFSNGMAYVENIMFDTLRITTSVNSNTKQKKGCICLVNCELNTIETDSRCDLFAAKNTTIRNLNPIVVYEVAYLDNLKSNDPIELNIDNAEVLLLNETNISKEMYKSLYMMVNRETSSKNRKLILYPFEEFKAKGVCSSDTFHYANGSNNPPVVIEGSFIEMFKHYFDDDNTVTKLIRKLNRNVIEDFVVYTDDPKMMEFLYKHNEGKKYQGVPAGMFYLLRKLLNK